MEITFINKDTGTMLPAASVIRQTENGIVTNQADHWKFIPTDSVTEEKTYDEYYADTTIPEKQENQVDNPLLAYSENASQQYTKKMEARFGFSDLLISTKHALLDTGIISDPIDVKNTSSISVTCQVDNPEAGSIELSIIDNTDEIPILPVGKRQVKKEHLFFELPTRFAIDPDYPVIVYEDNSPVSKDYSTLTASDYAAHRYSISYTAAYDYDTYSSISDTIRIKLVIRQEDPDVFIVVHNVEVREKGGSLQWNSNP